MPASPLEESELLEPWDPGDCVAAFLSASSKLAYISLLKLLDLSSSMMMSVDSLSTKKMYGMWHARTIRNTNLMMYENTFYSALILLMTDSSSSVPKR
jgi:hypothetical protein